MKYALVWMSSESRTLDECTFDEWVNSDRNVNGLLDTKEEAISAFMQTTPACTWRKHSAYGQSFYVIQGYAVFPYNDEEGEWYDGDQDEPTITPSSIYYRGSSLDLVSDYMDAYTVDEVVADGEIDTETAHARMLEMLSALNDTVGTFRLDHAVWRAPYGYIAADFRDDWNYLYHKYYE